MKLKNGYSKSVPTSNTPSLAQGISSQLLDVKSQIVSARVKDIVLDEHHPKFNEVGQWNGIGTIYYEVNNQSGPQNYDQYARPYDPQSKTFPLINELVLLFNLPNQNIGSNTSNTSYYYLNPISIWNHPHHNAYPNLLNTSTLPNSQKQDYQQVENGSVRRVEDSSTEINLNSPINPSQNNFIEKTNIHPLMPFMGDVLHEGRHGQSLRFGSTSKSNSQYANNWSTSGENGDPLTILRNGQPKNSTVEGWIPITENANNDLSSIWLSSTQKIPFNLANENFISYTTPPITPASFNSPHIIINSSRIVLNAKSDSVLISGQKSVGLLSNESVNIESKQVYIAGNDIKLGSKDATQPVLKGDDTVELLKQVVQELANLTQAMQSAQIYPGGAPLPDPVLGPIATNSNVVLNKVLTRLNDNVNGIKSNFVKVK